MMCFFEHDDKHLAEINSDYRNGKILAGEMKQLCIDKATEWMENHIELRDQSQHLVDEFLPMIQNDYVENTAGSGPVGKVAISSSVNSLSTAESSIIIECPCGSSNSSKWFKAFLSNVGQAIHNRLQLINLFHSFT